MYTTITGSKQFKIYSAVALAALLMTILAVTLTAGQAQATTTDTTIITTDDDNNPIPQQQTTPTPDATPEACPGETGNTNNKAASVVDSGHYALFDVWWNDDEGELTNNVCPPSVEFVPAQGRNPARTDRSPSSIDITAEPPTIIHIPSSAKINLSDSTTYGNRTYGEMYQGVVRADNLEDRPDAQGTPVPDRGDGVVWALPACPPDGSASADDLCLSFSAALLNPDDWLNADGSDGGAIDYLVHHVHQIDIDRQDPRYVLVYDVPASGATEAGAPLWNSHDARGGTVTVAPGEYSRPLWFFTERGTYKFKVYSRGYPNTSIGRDLIVTSDVQEYIIHVGDELTVNKPPAFLVERSVAENSAAGIAVGESIALHDPDGDALSFRLSGPGSELFALSGDTDSNGRFTKPPTIVTATNTLDHEVRPQYLLTLRVSDGKGITGYADPAPDNSALIRIHVADVDEVDVGSNSLGLKLIPSATGLKVGETVTMRAVVGDLPAGATNPVLRWIV